MFNYALIIGNLSVLVETKHPEIAEIIKLKFLGKPSCPGEKYDFYLKICLSCKKSIEGQNKKFMITNDRGIYTMNHNSIEARINWKQKRGVLKILPYARPLGVSIENFFSVLQDYIYLYNNGGFHLHSAAGVHKKRAYLFSGPSGAGKSTISSLLRKKMGILSDDAIIVSKSARNWYVQASPFRIIDEKLSSSQFPIAALFVLKKAKNFELRPLDSKNRLKFLFSQVRCHVLSEEACKKLFDKIEEFSIEIPIYELSFQKKSIPFKKIISCV